MKQTNDLRLTGRDITPDLILALDAQQAQAQFNAMPLEEKKQVVLSAPWPQRQKLIMLDENPEQLVRALPEDEVYWTVKEIGPEDALPIISRLSFDQLQYFIDIECWTKDLIDMAAVIRWFKMLLKCREEQVLEWVSRTDERFLNFAFKKLFNVYRLSDDLDLAEASDMLPTWTIDGLYYFQFADDEARMVAIPFLHLLYKTDSKYFYYLMENTRWISAIELEEDVLRVRQQRMAEQGFSELDEAWSLYQYLSAGDIKELMNQRQKEQRAAAELFSQLPRLRYRFTQRKQPLFVHAVLQNIHDIQHVERIQREIISLANTVMIADCTEVREPADKEKAFNKVLGYINICLETAGSQDTEAAVRLMEEVPVRFLFRAGYSQALDLQKVAKLLCGELQKNNVLLPAQFIDSPWNETIAGLTMPRPLFYEGAGDRSSSVLREFETMDDIRAAEAVLEIAAAIKTVIFDCFGLNAREIMEVSAQPADSDDGSRPQALQLFMTVLARHILYRRTELQPVTAEELRTFLKTVFDAMPQNAPGPAALKSNLLQDTMDWLEQQYHLSERVTAPLRVFVQHCLDMLAEECGALGGEREIDTRYISVFLFRR